MQIIILYATPFVPMVAPAIHVTGMENACEANANAKGGGSATNILTV
jgi:hypothetical protein